MDFNAIWFYIKRFFRRTFKKIKRFCKKYWRRLVRHTKAGDYSLLIYTVVAFLAFILIISLLGKAIHSSKKTSDKNNDVATSTDYVKDSQSTTEDSKPPVSNVETPTDADAPARHPISHDQLVAKAKAIYEQNKDLLVIVNADNPLKEGHSFEQHQLNCGEIINAVIYDDLCDMLQACNDAGFEYNIISGYRDKEHQQSIMEEDIQNYIDMGLTEEEAKKYALKTIQLPGYSEHETGLSLDISSEGTWVLTEDLVNDKTYLWLSKHCHEYGFILRYPVNKAHITGIDFEPWHFRYVGKEASMLMYDNNLTLEEFHALLAE